VWTERASGPVLAAATLATALLAGLFYAFASAVMPGLDRTDDRTFVEAMQRINDAVPNPAFALGFFGAPLLTLAAWVLERRAGSRGSARWVLAALALTAAALVVTVAANIPLNDELASAGDPDRLTDPAGVRDRFEGPWVAWNVVRTVAATGAVACLGRALLLHGRTALSFGAPARPNREPR
jgi:uncharacterized membrane protein